MILDGFENIDKYCNVNDSFKKAFEFLKQDNVKELPVGKYAIDGENVFALVQAYTTRDEKEVKWEAHRKYLDIQCIVEGSEIMGYAPVAKLNVKDAYSEEKDIAFYDEIKDWTRLKLNEREFAVFFPEDAHKPCCAYPEMKQVKKIVIKVRV